MTNWNWIKFGAGFCWFFQQVLPGCLNTALWAQTQLTGGWVGRYVVIFFSSNDISGSVVNKDLTLKAKAKDLTIKAKAKDLTLKAKANAKDLTIKAKAKDLTIKANAKAKDLTIKAKAKAKDLSLDLKDKFKDCSLLLQRQWRRQDLTQKGTRTEKNNLRVAHKTIIIFM